jgi:hypothetical protein
MMPARRFPPPWSVEEQQACIVVRDWRDQFYFTQSSDRRGVGVPVSLFLRCCSASLSHVFAIPIKVRLLWGSLNV